ncbi:hypothetical protein AKJ38_01260 [candidate division MSBL1 archaeon SCGC-AAA259I14]|uniref:Transposase IS4-like domain-containing protein n=1 Tax=candidate division MSBL1 archaeon SCGC-AAA259I14 TaxID=1698268 RepID=A0A133UTA0_9EURY|nr:hypothetical protein AKJ38_01260 [candidate division MSBL1 archaeon SCGC-AAA259I14]
METLDGNSSDSVILRDTATEFRRGVKENLKKVNYLVADSKFYSKKTIRATNNDLLWISRVPRSVKEAKQITEKTARMTDELEPLDSDGCSYRRYESEYGGVKQRWLVIHSKHAEKRSVDTVAKAVEKEFERVQKQAKKLRKAGYQCRADARNTVQLLRKESKYHSVNIEKIEKEEKYKGRGRPPKNGKKEKKVTFYPTYQIEKNIETSKQRK